MSLLPSQAAHARTVVSLTFDDGSFDQFAAGSMMAEEDMHATFYVNSGQVGSSSYYMTWSQLAELYADGHEIGGHTLHHAEPGTQSADEQRADVCQDRSNLLDHGFAATSFAYTFGTDRSSQAIARVCGYNGGQIAGGLRWGSECLRCALAERVPPTDPYHLRTAEIHAGDTGRQLAGYVAHAAAAGGGWLIFPFNRVCDGCSAYGISPAELRDFIARLRAMVITGDVQVRTVQQVIRGQLQPVAEGSVGALPQPSPTSGVAASGSDTVPPLIVRLSVSSHRFAVARANTALTAVVRRGVTFRYMLSEPARVVFRVQRVATGRRVGGRCRPATVRLRSAGTCRRYVPLGSFSRTNRQLKNRVRFTGRIGTRALRTGRHRVLVRAVDAAGNRSTTHPVNLTVVRGRGR